MSKKTDRQRRLRLFDRGNTQCPVCLTTFTKKQVAFGKKVTLEHVPPKALGGKVICLTCVKCNNSASRLDYAANLAEKVKDDYLSGRGARVEVDFFGGGIRSGYIRPEDDLTATRFAQQPLPTSIRQLRGGVMKLPSLPIGPDLDVKKGIRFRIKRPNPHHVAVSWLRSAYLLVFSLFGREGYRFAKSPALRPVREQILNPDEIRIKDNLSGEISGVDFPVDPLIMLNYAHKPPFWVVKIGNKCVFLPCGGSIERFVRLTRKPIDMSVKIDRAGYWASRQFRNESVLSFAIDSKTDVSDVDFVGGLLEIQTREGAVWEWMIVDYQANEIVALPFRPKGQKQDENVGGVLMMLGRDEFLRRKDRSKFAAASPAKLLSLTVER